MIATAGVAPASDSHDERAFEATVGADSRRLYSLALSILRDTGEAEDAVQETLLKAWRSVATSEPTCGGDNAGGVSGDTIPLYPAIHGKPLSLEITAGPSVAWEVAVADSGPVPPLPALGGSTRPAGARVLVDSTLGTGTSGVATFVPTGPYYVQYACTGTGAIDFSTSDGSAQWVRQNCANGVVRTQVGAKPRFDGIINVTVLAAPRTLWDVVIYELAGPKT